MNVGDIVRVVKQPHPQMAHIVGEVAYINEVGSDDMADIVTIHEEGRTMGTGWVPMDCLVPETDEKWKSAKAKIDAQHERHIAECHARGQRFQMKLREVATKHGLKPETVEVIWHDLNRAHTEDWR